MIKLCDIGIGKVAKVEFILAKNLLKERFLALGLTKGSAVEVIRKGPKDNLTLYKIRGAMIALRKEEASLILVKA
ncbi:FeoA family protein [Clostridium hydrogeniformans]|uniref:FeoA family protein n=1 Tax=Clostridium hydrogeniformans TaxID=349933 RepID=UPI00048572A2|nr:FeoA family protein [Clostridium hydrogeniformans]